MQLAYAAKKLAVISLLTLTGCATMPTKSEFARANYGAMPVNYEQKVKDYFKEILFDPFTAQIEVVAKPEQAWWRTGNIFKGFSHQYGWRVPARVNAKNRYGAYVGWQTYWFYFRGEDLGFVQKVY